MIQGRGDKHSHGVYTYNKVYSMGMLISSPLNHVPNKLIRTMKTN